MQDRANVSADFLELMKQEIIEVIKKYIEIDESAIDVRLTNKENNDGTNGAPALYANIPILNIKNEARKVKVSNEKENNQTQKDKESSENKESIDTSNNEQQKENASTDSDKENTNNENVENKTDSKEQTTLKEQQDTNIADKTDKTKPKENKKV